MKHIFTIAAFALVTPLIGCAGFQPMHGTKATQTAFTDMAVTVGDGEDERDRAAGFLLRQYLAERIGIAEKPTYQLIIEPRGRQIGLGLTGQDFATRYDGTLIAEWSLNRTDDGTVVAGGRTQSTATYSANADPYRLQSTTDAATERAARDLTDRLLTEIALELGELPTPE